MSRTKGEEGGRREVGVATQGILKVMKLFWILTAMVHMGTYKVIQLLRTNIHTHTDVHTDEFKLKWGHLNEPDGLYQY